MEIQHAGSVEFHRRVSAAGRIGNMDVQIDTEKLDNPAMEPARRRWLHTVVFDWLKDR